MHRSRSGSFRGHSRQNFDDRRFSPPRRFGSSYEDGRRLESFRSRSPPRGDPGSFQHRSRYRDDRSLGVPAAPPRVFDGSRRMYQLRVENLVGDEADQVLKHELMQVFRRHGSCSVYVTDNPGDGKEAYVTFWNVDEARSAKREENSRLVMNRPIYVHVQREPRVFVGGGRHPVRAPRNGNDEPRQHRRQHHSHERHGDQDAGGRPDNFHGRQFDEDSIPTRTLFVGNLDSAVDERTMYEVFGKFGVVEDVDIKVARVGSSGTFAFVKFAEVVAAKEAKQELHYTMLGNQRMRLGYGRGTPSARIHVSRLGSWCSLDWLEREFDRFGAIHHIEYTGGSSTALVSFDSVDAASAAAREMNGAGAKDAEHAIVVSFAEGRQPGGSGVSDKFSGDRSDGDVVEDSSANRRHASTSNASGASRRSAASSRHEQAGGGGRQRKRQRSSSVEDRGEEPEAKRADGSSDVVTLEDMSQELDLLWTGSLGLRNMSFPMHLYLVGGSREFTARYLCQPPVSVVAITQRLRLDADKLEEVRRRMAGGGDAGHCVLLALPAGGGSLSAPATGSDVACAEDTAAAGGDVQNKPLRNLVMFLKQKQAAGVAQLPVVSPPSSSLSGEADSSAAATPPPTTTTTTTTSTTSPPPPTTTSATTTTTDTTGVLHAFPPGDFAMEQLRRAVPNVAPPTQDSDYLVVIIVSK